MPTLDDLPARRPRRRLAASTSIAPLRLIQLVLPGMRARGDGRDRQRHLGRGRRRPIPTWGGYGASKAALEHLSRVLAAELEGSGIRVYVVDPGDMNTPDAPRGRAGRRPVAAARARRRRASLRAPDRHETRPVRPLRSPAHSIGGRRSDDAMIARIRRRRSTSRCRPSSRRTSRPRRADSGATRFACWSATISDDRSSTPASPICPTSCGPATCWWRTTPARCRPR